MVTWEGGRVNEKRGAGIGSRDRAGASAKQGAMGEGRIIIPQNPDSSQIKTCLQRRRFRARLHCSKIELALARMETYARKPC
jgi:hypothetical protein